MSDRCPRCTSLQHGLAGLLEWLDSPTVQHALELKGMLSITHRHLSMPVAPQFNKWATKKIQAARKALAEHESR